jgi:hypothetical protein
LGDKERLVIVWIVTGDLVNERLKLAAIFRIDMGTKEEVKPNFRTPPR